MHSCLPPRGFIALVSSVILSAVLLAGAVSAASSGLTARLGVVRGERKHISSSLARSCFSAALLKFARDYSYRPPPNGERIPVGSDFCVILSAAVSPRADGKTARVITRGTYRGAFTTLESDAFIPDPFVSAESVTPGAYREVPSTSR